MRKTLLRYVLLPLGLVAVFVAGVVAGSLWSTGFLRSAAAAGKVPGIVPISLKTTMTESLVYRPVIAVAPFDGAYKLAKVYLSAVFAGNKVAFWESEAGQLKSFNYPQDEFI